MIDLYRLNANFKYTEWFKKKRREKINKLKNEQLRLGKLFQAGDNLTICGNPIAMLMKVTGQNYLEENCFEQFDDRIQCCTTRFQEGKSWRDSVRHTIRLTMSCIWRTCIQKRLRRIFQIWEKLSSL